MDFAQKLLSHHSSLIAAIPYLLLVVAAVGLQYLQMARLNARNPQASQANPQAAMIQKYMPLIFGFIYLNVAAILNVYFIFSSAIRILTQEILFRRGIVAGPPVAPAGSGVKGGPKTPPGSGAKKGPVVDRTERALPGAKSAGGSNGSNGKGRTDSAKPAPAKRAPVKQNGSANGSNGRKSPSPGAGEKQKSAKSSTNGSNGSDVAETEGESVTQPKEHPRSKAKRERKAR
jgi:hypothetical protein